MILFIPYINILNLSWIIKCLFLRNMEPFTPYLMSPTYPLKFEQVHLTIINTEKISVLLGWEKVPGSIVFSDLYSISGQSVYFLIFFSVHRKAAIPCVIIHGMAKSVAYDVGDKVNHKKMKNNWNAVFVDGNWRFIHPYWGSQSARGYSTGR